MPRKKVQVNSWFGGGEPGATDAAGVAEGSGSGFKKFLTKKNIIIAGVVVIILTMFLIYWFVIRDTGSKKVGVKTKSVIPYLHDAKMPKKIKNGLIPTSAQGNEYNLNFWMYINDYTYKYNDKKCVMFKGDETDINMSNPGIWLLPKMNTLSFQIGLQTELEDSTMGNANNSNSNMGMTEGGNILEGFQNVNSNFGQANPQLNNNIYNNVSNDPVDNFNPIEDEYSVDLDEASGNFDTCDIKNIPLQRWLNINMSIYNNLIDISINGKLEKSCILKGFPIINKGNLHIGNEGGFNGFLSNVNFTNKALSMDEINNIYLNGPTLQAGLLG